MYEGKNCLTVSNGKPAYDLSGDTLVYPLFITRDGKKLEFICHLKLPTADRICKLLADRKGYATTVKGKESGVDIELMVTSEHDCRFFDEHLIGVTYRDQTLTMDQLEKLDRINFIRTSVIGRGFLQIGSPLPSAETDPDIIPTLEELLDERPHVEQTVLLGGDDGSEYELKLVHHFEPPTAKQSADFSRYQKMRFRDHGVRKMITKFPDVVRLYDAMVFTVDGVIGNRAAVVERLPAQWKIQAVQQLFQTAERKNA